MLTLVKLTLYGLLLLQSSMSFITYAQKVQENLHYNATSVKEKNLQDSVPLRSKFNDPIKEERITDQLKLIPMPLLVDEHYAVIRNLKDKGHELNSNANESLIKREEESEIDLKKEDSMPNPLTTISNHPPSVNRTGRQLFYSPNYFYIQNIGIEGSKCVTSRGLLGICLNLNRCNHQQQRSQRQLNFYNLIQFPPFVAAAQAQQQSEDICSFYDQYSRTTPGVCCTDISNVGPFQPGVQPPFPPQEPEPELQPPMNIDNEEETSPPSIDAAHLAEDSDVLEPPLNFLDFQPDPPKYDTIELQDGGNQITYDPVENLKQSNNYNYNMRNPWFTPFFGFSGMPQWPPPLPTHPPSSDSWPPPIPTHPPNHHYPTHPAQGQFTPAPTTSTRRPAVTPATTKRPPMYPGYPSYPTYRPMITTTTTTTTTTRKPIVGGDSGGGTTPAGLPLQCGTKNVGSPDQERIVGGTNASPHEFPWIAVLFKSGKQFCGGSLITNSHILTAAHCVSRMTSWDVAALTVHLGDYNIRTDYEVQHVSRRVKRLVRHKGFEFSTLHNDVAVLTLSEPVKYTSEIQPICLPTSAMQQTRSYSGHVATVAGWGSLRENGPQPSILQKVQIPIWTNTDCALKYGRAAPGGIIESMLCAGQASKDSCSGDSGGPMIVSEGGRYVQVGIVSWGIGCGKGQYPGVYTRVTSLLPWIYKNLK